MVIREASIKEAIAKDRAGWVKRFSRLPIEQDVLWAQDDDDGQFHLYKFFSNDKELGFAVVKVRKHILADLYFGPMTIDPGCYESLVGQLIKVLRKKHVFVLRIIPPGSDDQLKNLKCLPSHFNWATIVLDLHPDIDKIFLSINDNHRYGIRRTLKEGLMVVMLKEEGLREFTNGYLKMFKLRGIKKNAEVAYKQFNHVFTILNSYPEEGMMLCVYHSLTNEMIAGGVFIKSGDTMYYRDGFSDKIKGWSLLHIVIWKAICMAKERGCTRFDMGGYSLANDKQLQAINDFKRWFSPNIIVNPPTKIIEIVPFAARILRFIGKEL